MIAIKVLLVLLVVSLDSSVVESCSCAGFPCLQSVFCSADFVIRVEITAMDHDCPPGDCNPDGTPFGAGSYIYSTDNIEVYKVPGNWGSLVKEIWTADAGATCGVHLTVGETYLLTGSVHNGKVRIGLCSSIFKPWSSVTKTQKKGLKRFYKKNCNSAKPCNVCGFNCVLQIPPNKDECVLPGSNNACYCENSICQRKNGACQFKKSKALKKCLSG